MPEQLNPTIDELVRDLTTIHSRSKSEVRRMLEAFARSERIEELSHVQLEHGAYVTGTFPHGHAMTIEDRIAELQGHQSLAPDPGRARTHAQHTRAELSGQILCSCKTSKADCPIHGEIPPVVPGSEPAPEAPGYKGPYWGGK